MSVFHPGIRAPALTDYRANVRAGDDIDPRRRRALTRIEGYDVFASIGRESPQSVVENAFARRERICRFGCRLLQWLQTARHTLCRNPAFHLLGQCLDGIVEHNASYSLEQDPVLLGKLFGAAHEDPTRFVENLRFGTRVDQPHYLVLQDRPVSREILVHDHQIRRQALHPPIGMGLQHLF